MARQNRVGKHATTVATSNESTKVTYHSTVVVDFNRFAIFLDSGGWQTATTKTRMNQASNQFDLGFRVYQKDFDWFVDYKGKTIDFKDGMRLSRI